VAGLRWGIVGTGGIAADMVETLQGVGSTVAVVGSSRAGAAAEFASRWGIARFVPSHRGVPEVDEIDVVYVATTNDRHHENVLDCIAAGKPVVCEKPFALNAAQASEMLDAATAAGVFVMEGLWMRFQPFLGRLDELIADGAVGEVRHVEAGFGFPVDADPARRWMNRRLGGGSLLDLGIYALSLAHHLLGPPMSFEAMARVGPTGVDLDTSVMSRHRDETSAVAKATFTADMTNEAVVAGSDAVIRIHAPFHHSPRLTVERHGDVVASHDTSYHGHGFRFEIAEVERCLADGLTESPRRTHADTLAVLEWMDAVRARCGISFPQEEE
jgi:predicted dehydrogenase